MARTLIERYQWAKDFLQQADNWLSEMGFTPISEYIYRSLDRAVDQEQVKAWSKELTALCTCFCYSSSSTSFYNRA